ncbi:IS701 family transposase, partial [Magnetococcales bacterium HHB-1]
FGQGTREGVYRWLILSFLAFILAHWVHLETFPDTQPDWGMAAEAAMVAILSEILVFKLIMDIERLSKAALDLGFQITVQRCKM